MNTPIELFKPEEEDLETPSIIGINREDEDIAIICAFPYGIQKEIKENILRLLIETTDLELELLDFDLSIPEVWSIDYTEGEEN